ncbi:MAG: FHA domain-containing protein [Pseudomonadota bacterium]
MSLPRFRLRFLLQEIDLPQGATVIGRSATCQVTIEDPLVSREHARIRINGERATIEDLGSRNGVQVAGAALKGVHVLADGDRVRIGTQEMVFLSAPPPVATGAGKRTTGFMCHCSECGHPYPLELLECPACGSSDRTEEDTLAGAPSTQRDWGLDLVVEQLRRAESLGRTDDIERILSHARMGIEQRISENLPLERHTLDAVADVAATLAVTRGDAAWGKWLLSVYASVGNVPPRAVGQNLILLPPLARKSLAPAARRVVESVSSRGGPRAEDREGFARLEALGELGTVGA